MVPYKTFASFAVFWMDLFRLLPKQDKAVFKVLALRGQPCPGQFCTFPLSLYILRVLQTSILFTFRSLQISFRDFPGLKSSTIVIRLPKPTAIVKFKYLKE